MNKISKFISLCLVCAVVFAAFPGIVSAEIRGGSCGADGDNVIWSLDDSGKLTISGSGEMELALDDDYKSVFTKESDYITSVEIAEGVTTVSEYAFYHCEKLKSVKTGDGLLTVGGAAFSGCIALETVELPDSVASIGGSAFNGCSSLKSIDMPEKLSVIETNVFYGCSKLETVTVPAGVKAIGNLAFKGCASLTAVNYAGCEGMWEKIKMGKDNGVLTDHLNTAEHNVVTVSGIKTCSLCGKQFTEPEEPSSKSAEEPSSKGADEPETKKPDEPTGIPEPTSSKTQPSSDPTSEPESKQAVLRGDADLNGTVNAKDARLVLRASAKLETLSGQAFENSDLDGDGKLTAKEARKILRYSAKLEKSL